MRKLIIGLSWLSILFFSSCATIFTGTNDRIRFKTNVPGATVFINGVEQCKTPCSTNVKRKSGDSEVEIKLDGYETRIIQLDKTFNVVSVLNFTNLIGWGVDVLSGAIMKYDKKAYDLELVKEKRVSIITPLKIEMDTTKKTVVVYMPAQ